MEFLPVCPEDVRRRGWDAPDFVYVVGEAYVDHPSFGHAIISRVLENAGYKIAMLCLPEYHSAEAFKLFGRPKLGFLVSSGVIDSMVNHYTTAKKRRNTDVYAPGGKAGLRPDRAVTVYCNRIHEAYPGMPVLIGGVEASLRRFSHYDYWDDKVRRSVLVDSAATLLMYGMGEKTIIDCCDWVRRGMPAHELPSLTGVCYMAKQPPKDAILIPSHQEVATDKKAYCKAFMMEYGEQDPVRGKALCQQQDSQRYLVQNPPAMPLKQPELDKVYDLPFTRLAHPSYDKLGGVPALQEVRFSLSAVRGCFGSCNFCALTFHQGRVVTSRSEESLVKEAKLLTTFPDFKGYIHDVGGPTANFRSPACDKQLRSGACKNRQCLYPSPCKNMKVSHEELCRILRRLRSLPRVKKVFIRSGVRFDYLMADKSDQFLHDLCKYHVSGQLKVAPEHVSQNVLQKMGKPNFEVYKKFTEKYAQMNHRLGMDQYLVPYLMSSHPGSTLKDAVELAEYLRDIGHQPEQVQDFYPTPGTMSTCMYYTGIDPRDMTPVYVPKTEHEKAMQRALMQFRHPRNHALVREALRLAGREDLIGYDRRCLVRPEQSEGYRPRENRPMQRKTGRGQFTRSGSGNPSRRRPSGGRKGRS
ncbi:MAG: YgiQ family radical SAM protein [Clostridia bacterium]|nr:YgiQ family radical SAM protein [Clostridia bacterium]